MRKSLVLFSLLLLSNLSFAQEVQQPTPHGKTNMGEGMFGSMPLQMEVKMLVDVCKKESKNNAEYEKCMNSVKSYYESQKNKERMQK